MSIKSVFSTLILMTVISSSLATSVKAQPQRNPSTFNMDAVSCRDLLLAGTEDRALMMSLFHGFFNGKKNETMMDTDKLAKITDEIQNHCVDNPQKSLMSVFQKYRG